MIKVLVTDSLGQEGLDFLAAQKDVETIVKVGLQGEELAEALRQADALIVRSGTDVTAEVLADPSRLRVIARAGVGVDNIALDAATAAGVLVMNTPNANTISTAELTMAHMLALSRKVVPACQSVKEGKWDRKSFKGVQLAGRTLGIIGFGRIGRALAKRALAMEMNVVAYDPFFPGEPGGGVRFADSVDALMEQIDVLTVHTPLTDETRGIVGAAELAKAKPGLMVINCARGGIIDEAALADAVRSGRVAGAGVDVYTSEPPEGNPLIGLDGVVATPHLGASTTEAQAGVALEACRAVLAYLRDGDVQGAVNVAGVDFRLDAYGKRVVDLAQRLGCLLADLSRGPIRRLKLTLHGDKTHAAGATAARFMLVELLQRHLEQRVNVVNVVGIARERDLAVEVVQAPGDGEHYIQQIEAQVSSDAEHSVAGSVAFDDLPHIWQIDGYRMDIVPEGQMVVLSNADKPGVIGVVGHLFGDAGVNIANMTISRQGRRAMMVIHIDGEVTPDLLTRLREPEPILWVESVKLEPTDR